MMKQRSSRLTDSIPPLITPHQKRRQRARALARRLTTLAKHFPEFSHLIEDPLLVLQYQSNRALVLHAIHTGAWTIEAITRETRLSRQKVQTVLDALVHAKIILTAPCKEENTNGGRPRLLYFPHPNSNP